MNLDWTNSNLYLGIALAITLNAGCAADHVIGESLIPVGGASGQGGAATGGIASTKTDKSATGGVANSAPGGAPTGGVASSVTGGAPTGGVASIATGGTSQLSDCSKVFRTCPTSGTCSMTLEEYCNPSSSCQLSNLSDCSMIWFGSHWESGCGYRRVQYWGDVNDHATKIWNETTGELVYYWFNGVYSSGCLPETRVGTEPTCDQWADACGTQGTGGAGGGSNTGGTTNGGTSSISSGGTASGGTTTGNTSAPDAGECGDPAILNRFDQCMATTDNNSCEAAGGVWVQVGSYCSCPTGQGDCSCNEKSQCRGSCISDSPDCTSPAVGHCSKTGWELGCFCFLLDEPGIAEGICVD